MKFPVSISVGFGSAFGGLSRFYTDIFLFSIVSANVYISLLLINVFGSFLLGFFLICSQVENHKGAKLNWYFWGVGFCGGFTSFSSFTLLLVNGLMNASAVEAAIYATFSVLGGFLAVVTGLIIGQKLLLKP